MKYVASITLATCMHITQRSHAQIFSVLQTTFCTAVDTLHRPPCHVAAPPHQPAGGVRGHQWGIQELSYTTVKTLGLLQLYQKREASQLHSGSNCKHSFNFTCHTHKQLRWPKYGWSNANFFIVHKQFTSIYANHRTTNTKTFIQSHPLCTRWLNERSACDPGH